MDATRYRFVADWQAGSFANCRLDTTVNVSAYQHPAIIPGFQATSTTTYTGDQLFSGSGGATKISTLGYTVLQWADLAPVAYTTQAGDGFQFTTTAQQVTVLLAGIAASGMGFVSGQTGGAAPVLSNQIRNGAKAQILVDGTLVQTVDCYQATPQAQLFLDGASHTIKVIHSGLYDATLAPVGPVTNSVGTSVGTAWTPNITVLATPTFLAAKWRIQATAAGTFDLYKTPVGGSETRIYTGLVTNTLYSGSGSGATGGASAPYIPGISFQLTGTLTVGDSASIATDPTMVGVQSVTLASGTGTAAGAYTSAVVDSGAADTQWFLAEWTDNQPMASFALVTGQNVANGQVVVDGTYARTTVTPLDRTLPVAGTHLGSAGLMAAPRGRYAQWTLTFPTIATTQPYFRDLALYSWVPERDPRFAAKLALGKGWTMGPNLNAFLGSLAATLAATSVATDDFAAGYTINSAVDQYLAGYGADLGLPQFSSEQASTYRQRLVAQLANRPQGGSLADLAAKINILVNGQANTVAVSGAGVSPAQASCGGVVVKQTSGQQFSVAIPPYPYAGLPGLSPALAQSIIKQYIASLTPVNSVIDPNNAGTYNVTFS